MDQRIIINQVPPKMLSITTWIIAICSTTIFSTTAVILIIALLIPSARNVVILLFSWFGWLAIAGFSAIIRALSGAYHALRITLDLSKCNKLWCCVAVRTS